jgi:hypothetical protein
VNGLVVVTPSATTEAVPWNKPRELLAESSASHAMLVEFSEKL